MEALSVLVSRLEQNLSAASMLGLSFRRPDLAGRIDQAVYRTVARAGFSTDDIAFDRTSVGTAALTDAIIDKL